MKIYNDPPKVSDNFVVLPDLHCPCEDEEFIDKVSGLAASWGIKDAVIAGDLLDLESLSSYVNDVTCTVEYGLEHAEKVIDGLLQVMDNVVWIMGNHEERLLRVIGKNQISFERLKRLVSCDPRLTFSEYFYAMSDDGRWMICHPAEFSVANPLGVTSLMAAKYGVNVITGHMHVTACGQDLTGKYYGVVAGMCADPDKLGYAALRPNKKPHMERGAVIVQDGYPWLLTKWSDWQRLHKLGA